MAIVFTTAPVVSVGDSIKSSDQISLAEAFNSRIRSGVGDCAWRIAWYAWSMFKFLIRDADENTFHASDEWFYSFSHYEQNNADSFPDNEPGDPEGLNNQSNPIAQWFAGNSIMNSEDGRLQNILELPDLSSFASYWDVGMRQRGYVGASPCVTAAQEHFKIASNPRAKFMLSYGGFQPTPEQIGSCGEVLVDGIAYNLPAFGINFTPLVDGLPALTYAGFCEDFGAADISTTVIPANTSGVYDGYLKGMALGPQSYKLYLNDGSVTTLKYSDYLLGPFTGSGTLYNGVNDSLDQFLNRFILEFRGIDDERLTKGYNAGNVGFDFERFLKSQYLLAPRYSSTIPTFSTTAASIAANTNLEISPGVTTYGIHSGYKLTGVCVKAINLTSTCSVVVSVSNQTICTITLSPDSNCEASAGLYFTDTQYEGDVIAKVTTATTIGSGGSLSVEIAELQDYKPNIIDAYLLLRLASANPAITTGNEPLGGGVGNPKQISQDYFVYGCIVNRNQSLGLQPQDSIVQNAIYESARRQIHDNIRILSPYQNQLLAYEVTDGKSILYFSRYALGNSKWDTFRNIAPNVNSIPSGSIKSGLDYIVRSGSVTYLETVYNEGQTFTGVSGSRDYSGGGEVYEYDGIRHDGTPNTFSNEWVGFITTQVYSDSDSSIWKPDNFAYPRGPFHNPCHFYSSEVSGNELLRNHITFGQTPNAYEPESPSGYNYVLNVNHSSSFHDFDETQSANFYKSCQIYKPPFEIESCTLEKGDDNEWSVVRVALTGRLQYHESAPSSVPRSLASWDNQNLKDQDYATDENRLMRYLSYKAGIETVWPLNIGDSAAANFYSLNGLTDGANGSIFPRFYFVRLIPKSYEDGNDIPNPFDCPFRVDEMAQMEYYARPMCEGFIDLSSNISGDGACDGKKLWDYTFENACLQANGSRWFKTLPESVRDDNPKGHGPLPRTYAYADVFNQYSNFINLLTRARLEIPLTLQVKREAGAGLTLWTPSASSGALGACSGSEVSNSIGSSKCAVGTGVATNFDDLFTDAGTWIDLEGNESLFGGKYSLAFHYAKCSGGTFQYTIVGQYAKTYFRVKDVQPALAALPTDLRETVTVGPLGMFGHFLFSTLDTAAPTGSGSTLSCGGDVWNFSETYNDRLGPCEFVTGGVIEATDDVVSAGLGIVTNGSGGELQHYGGCYRTAEFFPAGGIIGNGNLFIDIPTT